MDESRIPFEFRKRTLDHHFEQYLVFTRLILSLATASFSLLAALSGTLLSSSQYVLLAKISLPLLLVSMFAGILVQYRIMSRPLRDLEKLEALLSEAAKKGAVEQPIYFRKLPSTAERLFFHIQVWSFIAAFALLSCYMIFYSHAS